MNKIFLIIILLVFLNACQSAKDALTLKKKPASDEFLVQKKSPLVLPPNYGNLPKPSSTIDNSKNLESEDNEVTVILDTSNFEKDKVIKNSNPTPLEKSILKKIK
tara:strand:+ start:119 stop:433 length:315 start_codon:yes stop_codon:yes gene_type:complete